MKTDGTSLPINIEKANSTSLRFGLEILLVFPNSMHLRIEKKCPEEALGVGGVSDDGFLILET